MKYYNLKSIISATKRHFKINSPSESFSVIDNRMTHYIEPTFGKIEFDNERPTVILVSAVGATGKTALANVLSYDTRLPLLDLGKHKPVGDNTLTGLLTSTFNTIDLSDVFQGIRDGTYGVIIDGVDEGRSKTTEKAFEAFLDDIVKLCHNATNTSIVLLGRTQILEYCWLYLADKNISAGLITISPFNLASARNYIDAFTDALESPQRTQYEEIRDKILEVLGTAFAGDKNTQEDDFLSFIGYPPVLDAIVTLLVQEKNYYKIREQLCGSGSDDVEITLLYRIAKYILQREKDQKVVPNILEPLAENMPSADRKLLIKEAYLFEEQCMRLVSFCLNKKLNLQRITNQSINEKYEETLIQWLPEHPFLDGRRFRNTVFESVALATLIVSHEPQCKDLVIEYVNSHKYSYHLIYILTNISPNMFIPIWCLHIIIGSALEFRSTSASVEIQVDGPELDVLPDANDLTSAVEIDIEIVMGKEGLSSKSFLFHSKLSDSATVNLGDRLSSTFISLPCEALFSGTQELELTAPVEISADRISLEQKALILRHAPKSSSLKQVLLQADKIDSKLESVITNGVGLKFIVSDKTGLMHPAIQYAEEKPPTPQDPQIRDKYLRLKRILVEFRSHGRGALARYKQKIEQNRVLRNELGRAILHRLLKDNILYEEGEFYFIRPEGINKYLGISYHDLRRGQLSEPLLRYLRSIN